MRGEALGQGRKRRKGLSVLPIMKQFRSARIAAGMSLEKLAAITSYDRSICSDWERGAHIPSIAKFQDLCTAIGVEIQLSAVAAGGKERS